VGSFWKTFWLCMGSTGGVVGLYVGCATVGYAWAFWLSLGLSVVIALAWAVGPNFLVWAERIRDYPALLQRAGQLQSDNDELIRTRTTLEAAASDQHLAGVVEGRAQVLGAIKASAGKDLPKLVATESTSGLVYLLADVSGPVPLGARYQLESVASGVSRGVVEVTEYDEDKKRVILVCVAPDPPRYWEQLAEKAETDPGPPTGMRLNWNKVTDDDDRTAAPVIDASEGS